jgi:RNA ligase (TIGR02306 family)
MSNWKVSKQKIALFPHPNADKLELARIGTYQCVVQKGLYQDGDEVVFAPEKSILSGKLQEEWSQWLVGPQNNRVKSVVMRGEYSCGIIIPQELLTELDLATVSLGEDISEKLGITRYVPQIPQDLEGMVIPINETRYGIHDCEQFSVYAAELIEGERIVVTEKVHGSQAVFFLNLTTGEKFVTSKNQLNKGLKIVENDSNSYWRAAKNVDLWNIIEKQFGAPFDNPTNEKDGSDVTIQVFAEIIPVQKGYHYGEITFTIKVFDVRVNGESVPYDKTGDDFRNIWAPVIYDGPLDKSTVRKFSEGMECVSGKSMHIKEGVVVQPYIDRKAADGIRLRLKILNPKYKETGEEIN